MVIKMNNEIGAILLAGGKGERYCSKKQYIDFMGKPLWKHAYDTACKVIDQANIVKVGIDIPGGETRTMSVRRGLELLSTDVKRVLIIEAARPLVTVKQLLTLIEDCHDSTSFVTPLVDTVVLRDGTFLDRNKMYTLLTPQAFNYPMLFEAIKTGRYTDLTDDTRIMFEQYGVRPFFIETSNNLVKLTYKTDIPVLKQLYEQMQKGEII